MRNYLALLVFALGLSAMVFGLMGMLKAAMVDHATRIVQSRADYPASQSASKSIR